MLRALLTGGRAPDREASGARRWTRLAFASLLCASVSSQSALAGVSIAEWGVSRAKEPVAAQERAVLTAELRNRPQDATIHLRYGRILAQDYYDRRAADWRPAAAAFEFAVQLDPSLSEARLELGRLYGAAGRPGLAEEVLAETVAVEGSASPALADLSIEALRNGDLAVALWAARKAAPSGDPRAVAAAAVAAGVADSPDAAGWLAQVRRSDPARADVIAREVAIWRRAAAMAAPPASAPAAAPAMKAAPAGSTIVGDWRSCDAAANNAQSTAASAAAFSGGGSGTTPIGPQALAPLPAPCAAGPTPRMAVIEAVIVRQRDETQDLRGVNLLSALQLVARGNLRVAEHVPAGGTPTSSPTFLTLSLPDGGINYLLDILDNQTARSDVLAKPSLVALDRTPSVFFSGATITVPVSGQISGTLEEKAIGVSLSVTPTFVSDDEMLLAVNAGRSFLEQGLDAQLTQGIETTTNQVSANVRMKFDETLVLSGLVEREEELDASEVPLLGRLPIVKYAFANRNRHGLRNNVIVLLTPRRPNEVPTRQDADDSLLPVRYDRRLAETVGAMARRETPEAAALDALSKGLAAADLVNKLPLTSLIAR